MLFISYVRKKITYKKLSFILFLITIAHNAFCDIANIP